MKTVLITGSTDGIGKQTALELAIKGYRVLVHGKNHLSGSETVEHIKRLSNNSEIFYYSADLTDIDEVHKLAEKIKLDFSILDVIINNAGVIENEKIILPNGIEKTFMVNHLAHFLLTIQLLETLSTSDDGRIVNVSSQAQAGTIDFDNLNGEKYYDAYNAYALSKLANVLFTYKLARELTTTTTINCLHPGVIATKLLHKGWGSGGASLEEGAKTSLFAATDPSLKNESGLYFVNSKTHKSSAISYDRKIQERLWDISLKLTGLTDPFK
jgi:NAD(P)-dependent dehydrogenase (short-subunit alcohol dehydrogenase family)